MTLLTSEAVELRLHPSIWRGIVEAVGIDSGGPLVVGDAERLDAWAENACDNPSGQRADVARSIAGLIRVAGTLAVKSEREPSGGFWKAASS